MSGLFLHELGSTKRTLCGIVLFNLDMIFFHVFCMLTGLLCTDSTYSHVPGDKGDQLFFSLKDVFLALVFVQIELLQFVIYYSTFAK